MRFLSLIALAASAATSVLAFPYNGTASNRFSPIPGYPLGNGFCLTDSQAKFLVSTFSGALANTNRNATNATMQVLLASNWIEQSDSINILAGYPLGSVSFPGKAIYIANIMAAPPTPVFNTIQVYHDCTNIAWRWTLSGLGKSVDPIQGINSIVANPLTGQLSADYLEFNSIAWGRDVGWTCTPPPGHARQA